MMTKKSYPDLDMTIKFQQFSKQDIIQRLNLREGETKLGENIQVLAGQLSLIESLKQVKGLGARFALLGINEDIGPRANCGRGGAGWTFEPVLNQLIHLQSNSFLNGSEIVVVGTIDVIAEDKNDDFCLLKLQVEALDSHVVSITRDILDAGLVPVAVGGGHNNSFGLISAVKASTGKFVFFLC